MEHNKPIGGPILYFALVLIVIAKGCSVEKPPSLPDLSTLPIDSITSVSAFTGGTVISDGGSMVTARGVCWSPRINPSLSDSFTADGEGEGNFSSKISGLQGGTYYYIRAYATNSVGTSYGNQFIFVTTLSDINGNVYGAVAIGTQIWMTENLKTTRFNDNTLIPNVTENSVWPTLSTPAYCWYQNIESDVIKKYGALYNWFAVNTGKLCPAGWHIPSEDDWETLTDYLGGEYFAGGRLKEQGFNHWKIPNTGASNDFGFSALPGGYRTGASSGTFRASGYIGWWWAGKEYDLDWARNRTVAFDSEEIAKGRGLKTNGYSVRCLKD